MGGLLTLWDGHPLEDQYSVIAFAGRRWSNPEAEDGRKICKQAWTELFGFDDATFLQALWTAKSMGGLSKRNTLEAFLRGPLTPYAFERANLARLLGMVIGACRERVPVGFGRNVLDGILLSLRQELVQHEIREILDGLYEGWNGGVNQQAALLNKGRQVLAELIAIADSRDVVWQRERATVAAAHEGNTSRFERGLHDKLAAFLQDVEAGQLEKTGLLVIRYSLPDFFGWPDIKWSLQYEGSDDWVPLHTGRPKPWDGDYSDCPFFTVKHSISDGLRPLRARVEVSGYGGIGILFVESRIGRSRFRPARIENAGGLVQQPDNILVDDTGACWLGEPSTAEAFHNPAMGQKIHTLEIVFGS